MSLLRRAKINEDAFDKVYTEVFTPVFKYLRARLTGDALLAEDLAQETIVKLYKGQWRIRKDEAILPYAMRIAQNTLIDHWRKNKNVSVTQLDETTYTMTEEPSPAEILQAEDERTILLSALNRLPELQAQALTLYYLQDSSTGEIAEIMRTSDANVRQMISRGRKALKAYLSTSSLYETA